MKPTSREFVRKKVIPFILGHAIKSAFTVIGWTCKFRIEGKENLVETASKSKCIVIAWHNRVSFVMEIVKRTAPQHHYAALVSNSRDGEIMAVLGNSYKYGRAIRVPHNAKAEALKSMITQLKFGKEIMFITPDGPRGPRYKLKPGAAIAAKETGAKVIPLTWSADKVWRFRSWDRLMIPKPFSTIEVKFGNPISIDKNCKNPIEEDMQTLQDALLAIQSPNDT